MWGQTSRQGFLALAGLSLRLSIAKKCPWGISLAKQGEAK